MKVKFNGVEYVLSTPGLADMVAFERTYLLPSSALAEDDRRLEWVCFIAWRGLNKMGIAGLPAFGDEFLDGFEIVNDDDDAEAVDPTTAQEVPAS